jgi:integrase
VRVTRKGRKVQDVPFTEELVPLLRKQLDEDGKLWNQDPTRLRAVLKIAAKKAHVPHVSPHTLRHTFGWRWLRDGGDIYKLSKILGHASVAVTERHYAHLLKEDLTAAVDARDMGIAAGVKAAVNHTGAAPATPSVPADLNAGAKVIAGRFGGKV